MSMLQPNFASKKDEIWQQFADNCAGIFEKGETCRGNKLVAKVGEWEVTLDTHELQTQHGVVTFTRLRAPFVNKDGFRFCIYKESIIDEIKKFLGMQDIKTGYGEFDKNYVIQANDEEKCQKLFSRPQIRGMITDQPSIYMEVKEDEGYFKDHYPDGVDELYCLMECDVDNMKQLEELYQLFAAVLNTLTHLGSAYQEDPNLNL